MTKMQRFIIDMVGFIIIFTLILYMSDSKAAYTEYKAGSRIIYVHDDVTGESFFVKDAPQQYFNAKASGEVLSTESSPGNFNLDPVNLKRSKLEQKLKDSDLNLIEVNEYLRLVK